MSEVTVWQQKNPALSQRGIDEPMWNALLSTVYPGAKEESVIMAVDYCRARKLDIMLKPVHLVPMQVKDARTGNKEWRDVPMPGIGLYRVQADRSGNYAGADEPEFGETITEEFDHPYNAGQKIKVKYPEWCKYTVYKIVSGHRVAYTSKEYWLENYATASAKTDAPNAMWKKRPFAQLAKCAEAQALRKGWPEIGSEPTAEEMEGKAFSNDERDITPPRNGRPSPAQIAQQKQEQHQEALPDMSEKVAFLQDVAQAEGSNGFKSAWKALGDDEKAAIGITERNRILEMAKQAEASSDD